jgi:molecular chaperone GrpE
VSKKVKVKTKDKKEKAPPVEEVEQVEKVEPNEENPNEQNELVTALEKAQAQAAEYLDGWQRAQAEFANYKKRQEAERGQMMTQVSMTILRKLLPIVDDMTRAIQTMPKDLKKVSWCEGITLIKAKLDTMLEAEGVTPIETAEQAFNPTYHEAVTYEEADGYSEGQIIDCVQTGYMLGDRVLRPALVRVAKGPASPSDKNESS